MAQTDEVLALLRFRGEEGVTPGLALDVVGTMRLAARVAELREAGHDITNEWMTTPRGKRVARYVIHEAPEQEALPW